MPLQQDTPLSHEGSSSEGKGSYQNKRTQQKAMRKCEGFHQRKNHQTKESLQKETTKKLNSMNISSGGTEN